MVLTKMTTGPPLSLSLCSCRCEVHEERGRDHIRISGESLCEQDGEGRKVLEEVAV